MSLHSSVVEYVPGVFALIVAAAGWYYAFYSRAAHRLAAVELGGANRRRVALRRAGGVSMILLGASLAVAYYVPPTEKPTPLFVVAWLFVIVMLFAVLALGLIDLRMTSRLRRRDRGGANADETED